MLFNEFVESTHQTSPPGDISVLLQALWFDEKGDWEKAHELAQDVNDQEGAWVHAYLHRKEGDVSNAAYWYRHAGKPLCADSLKEEWQFITSALLAKASVK